MLQKYHNDDLLNFLQSMKHRMWITQGCWKYDLTENSWKFMQQTTSISSEANSSFCN